MRKTNARARLQLGGLSAVVLAAGIGLSGAGSAQAAPSMQMPFPCKQTWTVTPGSSAHKAEEIDFNRGGSPSADKGDTVVAAAAGTVTTSAHQGSSNGYGNLVKIDHGSHSTYYAHLDKRAVKEGQKVKQGQKIGTLGSTSKPGNNISPHLHFEVRRDGVGYPTSIERAVFDGKAAPTSGSITSKNCGGGSNPGTPAFPGAGAFKLGKQHDAVLTLDKALIKKGYTKHHDGDGYQAGRTFTKYTKANVADFQRAQGWTGADADGYPGPETWKRLLR